MAQRAFLIALLALALGAPPQAQDAPATPLTLVSREGRRPVATQMQAGRELVTLDEVARLFGVSVKEDALAGGVTVSSRGKTIVVSANRPTVSVDGRLASLPSPVLRSGRTWLVPVEFFSMALASILDQRIEVRRASRLVVMGDIRLPRVTFSPLGAGPPSRLEVQIAPGAAVTATPEAGRLVLRIDADALDLAPAPAPAGLIDRIRLGEQPNLLLIGLAESAGTPRATVTPSAAVTRVAIEVPPAVTAEPRPAVPEAPRPSATAPAPPAPAEPPLAINVSRAWQTIAIDPGHGGADIGVRGPKGAEEKTLTLDIARRLRMLVENRLGLRVIMTRDDDRALSLDERASLANNGKADLLISLHVNGSPAPSRMGAEVFHVQLDQETVDRVRQATAGAVTLPTLGGGARRLEIIPWDLAQAKHLDESNVLVGVLEEELRRQVPMSDHPIREAPMRLLAGANMPAALVELAYLTNPGQESRLSTEEFKTTAAQALFSAIVRFRAWSEETHTP